MAKENTLIYRAQTGDEGAFTDLMRTYHAYVYAIVIGVVDNSHDAEEVVQDAFLNAYQGLRQLEDTTKFKSWLAEITRNCARQWLRKQRGETVSLEEVGEEMLQTEDSPDERLTQQEQRELIRRTMETLPQKDRDIAHAFYLEGASYDELTSTHGLSYNAIALRLFRVKRQLSKRLQYLLTGIFVSPGLTLKKLYTGGLTVMKIGTVPKITVGAAALIALIFIGFVGVRQMNSPTVEERVYLSPWEDGTARPRNRPEGLAVQTDSTQDTESGNNQSQIAAADSAEGIASIDDFVSQPDETNLAQFATEVEFEPEVDQSFTVDTSMSPESTSLSAEDVMYAYVEAFKNLDANAMRPLVTGTARELFAGELFEGRAPKIEIGEVRNEASDGTPDEVVEEMAEEMTRQLEQQLLDPYRKMYSQTEVVSGGYVGDEFHFQLRKPALEIPEIPDVEINFSSPPSPTDTFLKMRKENGAWLIYEYAHAH